jgi:hypothetical protein
MNGSAKSGMEDFDFNKTKIASLLRAKITSYFLIITDRKISVSV